MCADQIETSTINRDDWSPHSDVQMNIARHTCLIQYLSNKDRSYLSSIEFARVRSLWVFGI